MKRDDHTSAVVPHVEVASLRDHGERDRVERVWERLEPKLGLSLEQRGSRRRQRYDKSSLAAMAAAAGFVLGVGLAGWLWHGDRDPVVVRPSPLAPVTEVFAAGVEPRSYGLPGGGTVTVEPGAIVDTVDRDGIVTLRLVRGQATFDSAALRLLVGEAQLSGGGRVQVRHDGQFAYITVVDGSMSVVEPGEDEERRSLLQPSDTRDQARQVRTRVITAARLPPVDQPQTPQHVAQRPLDTDDSTPVAELPVDAPVPASVVDAPWVALCNRHEYGDAAALLNAQPGAAAGVTDPALLQCIAHGQRELARTVAAPADKVRQYDQAMQAYTKLLDDPERALRAAGHLVTLATKAHDLAQSDAERAQYAGLIDYYKKRERALQLVEANRQGGSEMLEASEKATTLCNRIQAEAKAGNTNNVVSLSGQYKDGYPDGPCTETIDALLAQINAAEDTDAGAAEEPPPAEDN